MVDLCLAWKNRKSNDQGLLCNIYDGQIWTELSETYLKSDDSILPLCLALNVDWFQPFKHTQYSVGALYLTVLNLPRALRFKEENIILAGIIPGPKEPPLNINSFLQPLIADLQKLSDGIKMFVQGTYITVHAMINLIVCDIPATRKVLALPGHAAKLGCSKCLKQFQVTHFGDKPDYSGFDESKWLRRDSSTHRELALQYKQLNNSSRQKAFEAEHGLRFSLLLDLPGFDIIRYHVIDPMHNLFEGSAKNFIKLLLDSKIVDFTIIQKRSKVVVAPMKIGRLPLKMESNYCGFTADQWRNWVLVYSPIVLKDAIPSRIYSIWLNFVHACRLLCRRAIKKHMVEEAHRLLRAYCEGVEDYFGKQSCTMNMHLHLHLRDCAMDYGPLYGYWCFPFERYNGTIGNYTTNYKSIEKQFASKFLREQLVRTKSIPPGYNHLSSSVQDTVVDECSSIMSLDQFQRIEHLQKVSTVCKGMDYAFSGTDTQLAVIKNSVASVLRLDEQSGLLAMYRALYGTSINMEDISAYAISSKAVVYAGEIIR